MAEQARGAVNGVRGYVMKRFDQARKRLMTAEKEFVARGRSRQKELEAILEKTAAAKKWKKQLTALHHKMLDSLGVATHDDVLHLGRDLSRLLKKVEQLSRRTPRQTPRLQA
jgi:hypothetical protein